MEGVKIIEHIWIVTVIGLGEESMCAAPVDTSRFPGVELGPQPLFCTEEAAADAMFENAKQLFKSLPLRLVKFSAREVLRYQPTG